MSNLGKLGELMAIVGLGFFGLAFVINLFDKRPWFNWWDATWYWLAGGAFGLLLALVF